MDVPATLAFGVSEPATVTSQGEVCLVVLERTSSPRINALVMKVGHVLSEYVANLIVKFMLDSK